MTKGSCHGGEVRGVSLELAGERVELSAAGAAYLPQHSTLLVADLHFEKASSYAVRGQMLPPYDSAVTLARLAAEIERVRPRRVIALGDSFHDQRARGRMDVSVVEQVRAMTGQANWTWIAGNHDVSPPDDLGGDCVEEVELGALVLRHEPLEGAGVAEVAGHLHPCARVRGDTGSVRAKCFVADETRMILPSFGALTGGLNVCDAAFGGLFAAQPRVCVVGRDRVYEVSAERLVPDRAGRARMAG